MRKVPVPVPVKEGLRSKGISKTTAPGLSSTRIVIGIVIGIVILLLLNRV